MPNLDLRVLPILAVAALGWSTPARAASFPCDRAEAADERAVCAHLPLNDRDVEMAVRFAILKDVLPMGGGAKLREDQEAWLAERRTCGGDVACLKDVYDARLTVLRAVQSEFSKQEAP
ncbi:lysozyme inhibitor LprI family protein [uncultured Methylobacterium sp.]|uniref:lysozyme inhibitor LprI family protein n=1 Tax=uncultured Methylobacterium sp. TaxID=157278 RepID=UPI0035CC1D9B